MVPDRVERDVLIEAPIDVVWEVVTQPEHLKRWFCDDADIELRPGGDGTITWDLKAMKRPTEVTLQVEAVEAPRLFSYRWVFPRGEEARPGNSTLVEFTLSEEGGGTRLKVVESGIDLMPWPDVEKAKYAEDHANGWAHHFVNVGPYVETVLAEAAS